jgi:glycolate oxidase iron-sulfur subunit
MLGELSRQGLSASKNLADRIFSCMLCGACKNVCPTGIDIPEVIYRGRAELKSSYKKDRLLRSGIRRFMAKPDSAFAFLRLLQRVFSSERLQALPEITPQPFKNGTQVHKAVKKIGRVAVFAGCSVNYFYPQLGQSLLNILLSSGYEVVVFRGELCCGAPLRSLGFEDESVDIAQRNIEHFNKVNAEAIISLCPTCTMVIRDQYPLLAGDTIRNIMDTNEFFTSHGITDNLHLGGHSFTYHDPCHLSFGLGVRDLPRNILKNIAGSSYTEMRHADECCGFAGLFSMHFEEMSHSLGKNKLDNIACTGADTVVTSCPGCVMHLETLRTAAEGSFQVRHIVEVVDEAMHQDRDEETGE